MGRAISTEIALRRDIADTTTMTTCTRLARKGLLRREKAKQGYGYAYTPTISEREFVARALARVLDSIAREYPSALARYMDGRRASATA
jgi:predicted transcriptional regulator